MTPIVMILVGASALSTLGCRSSAQPAPGAAESVPSPVDIAILVARADRAFADSQRPDYRRPMQELPLAVEPAGTAYLAACRAGDRRSCWMAMQLYDPDKHALELVIQNCRAGDLLSCRSVNAEVSERLHLPGWTGKLGGCFAIDGCDKALLRPECDAGHPWSCQRLAERTRPEDWEEHRPYHDPPEIEEPIRRLARAGCEAGIVRECGLLALTSGHVGDELFADERSCAIGHYGCSLLGITYERMGEREHAYRLYERACQIAQICDGALRFYLDLRWPEPVPNRGRELANWYCRSFTICRLQTL